ncbi:MAG: dipeptide epimerase [Alphaproteobacteria bacterium]|nr:dipeptide epimerase [Alphaproteobacteria bacterium]
MSARLAVADERWPLREPFRISRGTKTEAHVVVATIERGGRLGRGECVPYARYGETVTGVIATIESARNDIEAGATRQDLLRLMRPGAARNALDCALWDLEAKEAGRRVWDLAGLPEPRPATTALTIALNEPAAMAAATHAANAPLLKVKLGSADDMTRLAAVRAASPTATLIVDPNEAWSFDQLESYGAQLNRLGVTLIEQPLPADADANLAGHSSPVPICADEALHTAADLRGIAGKYAAINIKLDKTGGLTAALELAREAQNSGLSIMIGCMVSTSLSMAPAFVLSSMAHFIDLDGPLLLAKDRQPGIRYDGTRMFAPARELWG